ncbi:antibiotic biosynthesis monooxygenase family protein [Streptomyces sp. NPDC059176]|uniref:antibiotic biosynthesis monooxygenase family protein n=1 Tax=unclassified Streptomyces TaxID=2593676 RepID=UPI0036D1E789
MSDHLVAGLEPPYFTVVFTSHLRPDPDGCAGTARRMRELVEEVPGFLGHEAARAPGGFGITVGYCRDEEPVAAGQRNQHRRARRRGRAAGYERYSVHGGKVERSCGFERA